MLPHCLVFLDTVLFGEAALKIITVGLEVIHGEEQVCVDHHEVLKRALRQKTLLYLMDKSLEELSTQLVHVNHVRDISKVSTIKISSSGFLM